MNISFRDLNFLTLNTTNIRDRIRFFQDHVFDNIYYTDCGRYSFRYTNMLIEQKIASYDSSLFLHINSVIDEVKDMFESRPGVFRIPVIDDRGRLVGEYYDASSVGMSLYKRIEDRCYDLLNNTYFQRLFADWAQCHRVACTSGGRRLEMVLKDCILCKEDEADVVIDTEICDQYRKYLEGEGPRASLSRIMVPLIIKDVIAYFRQTGVYFFAAYGIKKSELLKLTKNEERFLNKCIEEAVSDDEHVQRIAGLDEDSLCHVKMHRNDINRISKIVFNGVYNQLVDVDEPYFNIAGGKRVTIGQPKVSNQQVHLFGPCVVQGLMVCDSQTIPSQLQDIINRCSHNHVRVHNHGLSYGKDLLNDLLMMMSTDLSRGDIVVWMNGFSSDEKQLFDELGVPIIDCVKCVVNEHDWYYNIPFHCNAYANNIFANEIYQFVRPLLNSCPPRNSGVVNMNSERRIGLAFNTDSILSSAQLKSYISQLEYYKAHSTGYARIGSIVMHANPCTLGHLYLIQQALKRVDFVYIFLIQYTGKDSFDYIDREFMLRASLEDTTRVCIIPSGNVFATPLSFPEYFNRSGNTEINPTLDNRIFALHIAPALGIKYRFFGSEPNDAITRAFVCECQKYLPSQGVQVEVIERTTMSGLPISAKTVRQAWRDRNYTEMEKYVTHPTFQRLLELNSDNIDKI